MERYARYECDHHDRFECPDLVVSRFVKTVGPVWFGIPIHDGGTSASEIHRARGALRISRTLPNMVADRSDLAIRAAIDIDNPSSWPDHILRDVLAVAARTPGRIRYWDQLDVSHEDGLAFLESISGVPIRTYHCTKLLDHEVDDVRARGLGLLTRDLVVGRIKKAYEAGHLRTDQRDELLRTHVFALTEHRYREQLLWLIISRQTFDTDADGVWRLLRLWGGESIYWAHSDRDAALYNHLRAIGRPSIVVTDLVMTPEEWRRHNHQGLLRLFAGRLLGLSRTSGEVGSPRPVPADRIVDIWHPGSPDYDCHIELRE